MAEREMSIACRSERLAWPPSSWGGISVDGVSAALQPARRATSRCL